MASEKQDELEYGMRGGIPASRMMQIHNELPYPVPFSETYPLIVDPLPAMLVDGNSMKMKARVRLSDGWHMLCQVRLALMEAEACMIFYEEIRRDHMEALYHSRYYLDDAALRLCSSCEHMVQSIILRWKLSVKKDLCPAEENRDGSLLLALKAAELSKDDEVQQVAKILRKLRSNEARKSCKRYRDDWVHVQFPATAGLFPAFEFKKCKASKSGFPSEVLKNCGINSEQEISKMTFGTGPDIPELRKTIRDAYSALFNAYEELVTMLTKIDSPLLDSSKHLE